MFSFLFPYILFNFVTVCRAFVCLFPISERFFYWYQPPSPDRTDEWRFYFDGTDRMLLRVFGLQFPKRRRTFGGERQQTRSWRASDSIVACCSVCPRLRTPQREPRGLLLRWGVLIEVNMNKQHVYVCVCGGADDVRIEIWLSFYQKVN